MAEKDKKPHKSENMGKWVSFSKDLVALLRDLSVFVFAILLLAYPSKLNDILINAGFEEGSIVGFKWKRGVVELNQKLQIALDTIETLSVQNDKLSEELALASSSDGTIKNKYADLKARNKQVNDAVNQVRKSVFLTLENNASLIDKAVLSSKRESYPDKAFCYQEDRHKDGASRYSVHCHETKKKCEIARGPNKAYKQTVCGSTDLTAATWKPGHPGWMGSWYQYSRNSFGAPFPQF
ncbi:MAG: cell division protein ZapB [Gammaproteobacteria bacterium]|nr:cell division protein ZapB [Gammaproteobacteria bacterium]